MGLIPLPSKIDKRARLRNHLNEVFKNFKLEPEGVIPSFDYFFSTSNKFNSLVEAKADLDSKIYFIVESLDDGAYVLEYPHFYLPITTDMPQIILSKSIDGYNGQFAPRGNWFNISMSPIGGTWQWFGTLIHEYAHKGTSSINEIDKVSNQLTGILQEYGGFWNSWDDLITVDESEYVEAIKNNKFSEDYMTDLNRMAIRQDFSIEPYSDEIAKIDETLVRLKTNIAVSNNYNKFGDVFYDNHPFTESMVVLIEKFVWPDKKLLIMEKNK